MFFFLPMALVVGECDRQFVQNIPIKQITLRLVFPDDRAVFLIGQNSTNVTLKRRRGWPLIAPDARGIVTDNCPELLQISTA